MNKQEFKSLARAIKTYYPRDSVLPNKEALQLWYEELKDLSYEAAAASLRVHVSTEKWPPTIAEIRANATTIVSADNNDQWSQAWECAKKAIKRYGYYQETEGLESVDPLTRTVIKRLGWKELCVSENEMADRANFRDIYKEVLSKKMKYTVLPGNLKTAIETMSGAPLMLADEMDQGKIEPIKPVFEERVNVSSDNTPPEIKAKMAEILARYE